MVRLSIVLGSVLLVTAWATIGGTPAVAGEGHTYVGVAKCKMCHKSEAQGEQFPIWEKSAHAKAYATLAGDDGKAIAKEKGIEDPQKADACLKCHVTGYGAAADMFGDKYDMANGVGCESCHGAGSDYDKMSVMKAVMAGTTKPESVGLVLPTEKTCTACHNSESPTFKSFDFEKMAAQIAHPIPAERKAQYKTAE